MTEKSRGILADRHVSGEDIVNAMGLTIAEALRDSREAGNPVAVWDWAANRVVIVPLGQITTPDSALTEGEPATPREP